ncbi:Uncharacterized conserved protein YecE, DUF72 family [Daejeonella rubra]|uniref:Uncharacterized conserved protein YecE, DUF72 family n=1 Tax=Daejeonella rubra TaxID=990371 RepID=A0A1G9UFY8_9SPHI|nr:DUF72 domain-containing protein [Daejeonella rubra]SDM58870.1 Uncharacterized conserved protein YecE, DUF72 family [Daejeonella rubra]
MDFGRLAENEFPLVDFTLPADTSLTTQVLKEATKPIRPDLYVGCAKWGRKEWVGMIYPPKTKEADFLAEYVKHFNSIELNAIFYGMPKKEQVNAWRKKAEASRTDFKFFPKFTQSISHIKRLNDAEELTSQYLESISEFGNTLGPAFLQLSDNFGPKNFETLKSYLEKLPSDFDVFVEVRHKDWYEDTTARKDLFDMMHSLKKGSVITDASGRRDCVHMELTTPDAFIRFVGNGLHPTDFSRIDAWVERLANWKDQGLNKIYFFLHQHDEKDTPILADYTIKKLNEKLGTDLKPPGLLEPTTLF